jgi:hypothetical protein
MGLERMRGVLGQSQAMTRNVWSSARAGASGAEEEARRLRSCSLMVAAEGWERQVAAIHEATSAGSEKEGRELRGSVRPSV